MKRLILIMVLMFFIVACATQDQRAKTETTAAGVGIGAAIGAAFGYLVGDREGAAWGAAIGAALGGAAGYSYANKINDRREELIGKENDLDTRINVAHGINEETLKYNQKLEQNIEKLTAEIDNLDAKVKQQELAQRDLRAKQQDLDKVIKHTKENEAVLKKELDELKDFQTGQSQPSDELDMEIAKLEENLARLKNNTNQLASLRHRL